MITHKHEHPEFRAPRPRKVSRLKQLNKANRISRRHYADVRYQVLVKPVAVDPAVAA